MLTSEKSLEAKLVRLVQRLGGLAIKQTTINHIPDRLVIMPDGRCWFVELKSHKEKPRAGQIAFMDKLSRMQFEVRVISNGDQLDEFIAEISCSASLLSEGSG